MVAAEYLFLVRQARYRAAGKKCVSQQFEIFTVEIAGREKRIVCSHHSDNSLPSVEHSSRTVIEALSTKVTVLFFVRTKMRNPFTQIRSQIFVSFHGYAPNESPGQAGMVFHTDFDMGQRQPHIRRYAHSASHQSGRTLRHKYSSELFAPNCQMTAEIRL